MSLNSKEIAEKAREGQRKSEINEAINHESKLAFHAKPEVWWYGVNSYFRDWRTNIPYALLPHDKADRIMSILSYPLSTVDLTDSIFSEISRVFNAQNKSYSYEFTSKEELDEFDDYLVNKFNVDNFIQSDVFNAYKWAINSIVVIDLPENQNTLRPEPYAFVLSIDNVLASRPLKDGGFEYLIYKSGKEYFGITDERYVKMDKEFNVVADIEHNLGYVPARFMWHKVITDENPYNHQSLITNVLGELDWFLFFSASKKYNDLTGAFPIYVGYEEECDYEDLQNGGTCEAGFIDGDKKRPCPNCESRKLLGPGSMVQVPAPVDKDDADLGAHPVNKLDADTGSLKYCKEEIETQRQYIIESCVGVNNRENVDVAKNEQQVSSLFESRVNVLVREKKGFEILHKWIVCVFADIIYGSNLFKGCTINYGTEFYLKTLGELYKQYTSAKADGLPDSELDAIYKEIINVKYKNNETQLKRLDIMLNVEPYPHKNISELTLLYDKGLVSQEDFVIKINFNSFVKRFERENGLIENFGNLVDLKTRVNSINETFKRYVKDTKLPSQEGGGESLPS